MVGKTLNLLKAQKKYFIIWTALLAMTTLLLWKARWMLYLSWTLRSTLLSAFQTELLLIGLTLITWIVALNISMTNPKLSSRSIQMKPVRTSNRNSSDALELKYATQLALASTKMLMNFCYSTAALCSSVLLIKLVLFLLRT